MLNPDSLKAAPDDASNIAKRLPQPLDKVMTMDVSQSTTQQSGSVKPKHIRHLTVGYLAGITKNRPAHIRIVGRWVEKAGFREGVKVDVEVSEGRIVIRPAPAPYAGMNMSPPPLYICDRIAMTDYPVSSNTLSDAE